MKGLATRLHEALWTLADDTDTPSSDLPEEVRSLTTDQLLAMDIAADVVLDVPERWVANYPGGDSAEDCAARRVLMRKLLEDEMRDRRAHAGERPTRS